MPLSSRLKRHLTFILFVSAFAWLVAAMARPTVPVSLSTGQTTIVLTLDISRSMCMRDIHPTRLEVAKEAALSFVADPVIGTQVGVVAFAGFAELVQSPTTDPASLEFTITNLLTEMNTAIGSGILSALDAISEVDPRVPKSQPIHVSAASMPGQSVPVPVPEEDYLPHIIVLLTDGASNFGPDPLLAARQAAERRVRVYTIGFGTSKSAVMDCGNTLADNSYLSPRLDSPGRGGPGSEPDAATLREIARLTGGKFYPAASAEELQEVFRKLHSFVAQINRPVEAGVGFVALAAMIAIAAFVLSLLWHPLI